MHAREHLEPSSLMPPRPRQLHELPRPPLIQNQVSLTGRTSNSRPPPGRSRKAPVNWERHRPARQVVAADILCPRRAHDLIDALDHRHCQPRRASSAPAQCLRHQRRRCTAFATSSWIHLCSLRVRSGRGARGAVRWRQIQISATSVRAIDAAWCAVPGRRRAHATADHGRSQRGFEVGCDLAPALCLGQVARSGLDRLVPEVGLERGDLGVRPSDERITAASGSHRDSRRAGANAAFADLPVEVHESPSRSPVECRRRTR